MTAPETAPAERHMGEELAVTQADRDGAGSIMRSALIRDALASGDCDDDPIVQAFARHRIAHTADHAKGLVEALRRIEEDNDDGATCAEIARAALQQAEAGDVE